MRREKEREEENKVFDNCVTQTHFFELNISSGISTGMVWYDTVRPRAFLTYHQRTSLSQLNCLSAQPLLGHKVLLDYSGAVLYSTII